MDIFDYKAIKPMLISEMTEPFDSTEHIYELKLDGIRCIAYLDAAGTELRNKRDMRLLPKVPELGEIHKASRNRCILDGELIVLKNGFPDFFEVQKRALLSDPFKIQLAKSKYPASFVAFDILYLTDHQVNELPLLERKQLLNEVIAENERLAISRFIETQGISLFQLAKEKNLEGIVAKKKESKYWFDKRTKDWIKCKIMASDDCVICGYSIKDNQWVSLALGQYDGGVLVYKGHVTLGVSIRALEQRKYTAITESPFGYIPKGNENTIWLKPELVGIVESMPSEKDSFRQPVFKGFRDDKAPMDCTVRKEAKDFSLY